MCVIVSCGKKQGDGKLIPIEDFFVKPEKTNFRISPDGKKNRLPRYR